MADTATLRVELEVSDGESVKAAYTPAQPFRFNVVTLKDEVVSLTGSAFTALSPPTSAKGVIIVVGTTVSLVLKGVTGDTGVALTPSSNVSGLPAVIPLGASPSIGILNNGSTATVRVVWV